MEIAAEYDNQNSVLNNVLRPNAFSRLARRAVECNDDAADRALFSLVMLKLWYARLCIQSRND
jgi:hypothetical protein